MKLIIDIPEDRYRQIKDLPNAFGSDICKAIRNGTPYEERPQGYWNYIQAGMTVCPFCGADPHKEYKNFCAKCGANMRDKEKWIDNFMAWAGEDIEE